MKIFELTQPGIHNARRATRPDPRPRRGEVLVRMRAASLNYVDLPVSRGAFPLARFPLVPVTDGAGEIVSVGEGVQEWKPGDRVMPHFMPGWLGGPIGPSVLGELRGITQDGAMAEFSLAPASSLVRTPQHLSDIQAATLPIAATTAWNAFKAGGVRPGSTVVCLGTGGVSSFLLAFAKAAGARVVVVSSSESKLAQAAALGADDGINRREHPDWQHQVIERTGGRGADLVLESVGGESFARSLHAVAHGGTVFMIGLMAEADVQAHVLPIILKAARVQGNNTGSVQDFREAAAVIAARGIVPQVWRTYAGGDLPAAYQALESGSHFGKIALELDF